MGELLRVQGRLSAYNDQLELVVSSLARVMDANEESLHWLDCIASAARQEKEEVCVNR